MSEFAEGYAVGQGNSNNNCGYGMGGWGEWIWIIVLFALWQNGGFGFGGFGGGGCGRGNCATQEDVRAAVDQQTLINKLDQQTYGLADSTYALNNTIVNGFHGVDNAICNLGYNMQGGFNHLSTQLAQCCCETNRSIERGFCDTNFNLQNATRDIVDSNNAGTRAILDALAAQRLEAKDCKIAEQNQIIFGLQLAASQAAQNNYIINQLRPAPVPSYTVANPYAGCFGGYSTCGCGC